MSRLLPKVSPLISKINLKAARSDVMHKTQKSWAVVVVKCSRRARLVLPRVRILLKGLQFFSVKCCSEKNENKQKEAGVGQYFKNAVE